MNFPIVTDVIRRIQDADGQTLDVRPWPEAPSSVAIMNSDEQSKEWFGPIEIAMNPKFARLLGKALIACADEIEKP